MAQHKMDKDFRDKLNQREINPSGNAWDRLDAMLTVAEEKKPKRDWGWLYIAASIFGFLFLGTIYFSQTPEMIDVKRSDVVLEYHQPGKTLEKENPNSTVADSQRIAAVTKPEKEKINPSIQKSISTQAPANRQNNQKTNSYQSITNPVSTINLIPKKELVAINQKPSGDQNQKIIARAAGELAAGNQKIEQLTNAKVDELLAHVETAQKPGNFKPSVKVNAKSLLSQVDGEVNLSFREKMLRTINRNYQEVADAVSTRNIQQ